jgi:DNA-binding beta-propeller fold protein YncE
MRAYLVSWTAALALLYGVTSSAYADLLVSSGTIDNRVLSYDETTGAFLGTFASGGGLIDPFGLVYGPDGNLYVADFGDPTRPDLFNFSTVRRYDGTTGAFIDIFVPAGSGGLGGPRGLVFGPDGNLYVANNNTSLVLRYDGTTGAFLGAFASGGGLAAPEGLVFGRDGNLYVSSRAGNNGILRYDGTTGAFLDTFVAPGSGGLQTPQGLVLGADGNLYVGCRECDAVLRYDGTTGAFLGIFASGGGLDDAGDGLVFGPDGNLYVTSWLTREVKRYDGTTGAFLDTFASGGGLGSPQGLVFTPRGQVVPEPATLTLLSIGLVGIGGYCWRRLQRAG